MGSGTTGLAALELNRKFIGIEMNEEYFNLSKERIYEKFS
jgi:DNA modification methylase